MSRDNHFVDTTIKKFVEAGKPFKLSEVRKENGGITALNRQFSDVDLLNGYIKEGELKFEPAYCPGEEGRYIPI